MLNIKTDAFEESIKARIGVLKSKIYEEVVKAGNEIRSVAATESPVDTGLLRASWKVRENRIADGGIVQVYNTTKYWKAVEYGTRPHTITAKNKKVLANRKTGKVFGKTVKHPGTKGKPMIRPALKKVIPILKRRIKEL